MTTDPDETPNAPVGTRSHRAVKLYRRPLGVAWVVAAVLIPLLLAAIGYGVHQSRHAALPQLTETGTPSSTPSGFSVVSITRKGDQITMQGELPSVDARNALDDVIGSVQGVDVIDTIEIKPGVKGLDFSKAGPVFTAASSIPDFGLSVSGETVTLTGTPPSMEVNDAVLAAAIAAWPEVSIDNVMSITGGLTPTTAAPKLDFAPLSIIRNGNDITLSGDLPDVGVRTALLDKLKALFGSGVHFIDNLKITAGANAPEIPSLEAVLKAGATIPNFNFKIDGDTVTLTGTAASDTEKAAVAAAVKAAWPSIEIANNIEVGAASSTAQTTAQTPAQTTAQTPAAGGCENLQTDVSGLLQTPITFETDGYTLSAASQQQLTQVAGKLNACPNAHVAVNGYTDNTGNDAINIPLSASRAKSVADYLVSQGVASDRVTSQGMGSADPVASNDSPDGRAQNRRVAIVVS